MKAAVVVGFNDIRYLDIQEPDVGSGQVKVAVTFCGICGSDIPRVLNGSCHSFPQVLGHEFSGVISAIGDGVTSVKVGDHVVGVPLVPCMECDDCKKGNYSLCKHYSFIGSRQQGAMAEYVVVSEKNVFKIDKRIPLDKAAFFEPSTVALHGILINNFEPSPSDNICVVGAGTVAMFTIQWCKILGARSVTVIGRNKERILVAQKYGGDQILSSLDADCQEQVGEITSHRGFDYVFDAVGTPETIKMSMQIAANKSNVCFIGTPSQPFELSVKEWELINRKEMHITGSWMSYSKPWPGIEWRKTADCLVLGELRIGDDMISSHYALKDVKTAFHQFEVNRFSIKGRVLLDINSDCL